MQKFSFKKNDDEKINGTAKHRFNAEYSDEFQSKKGKKTFIRRTNEKQRQFAELH
jgi:hypothetical protein